MNNMNNNIIINLYNLGDIFNYFCEFLSFEDKIKIGKIFNINIIKNIDIRNNKIKNRFTICNNCCCEYICEQHSSLNRLYKNFLEYNDSSDSDDEIHDSYKNMYEMARHTEESEFVCMTFSFICNRAMLEILDKNNIILKNKDNKQCVFEIDEIDNLYEEFYNKIDEIYSYGIENDYCNIFCRRCGVFGHDKVCKSCPFFMK